jgi:hypothetical protein
MTVSLPTAETVARVSDNAWATSRFGSGQQHASGPFGAEAPSVSAKDELGSGRRVPDDVYCWVPQSVVGL